LTKSARWIRPAATTFALSALICSCTWGGHPAPSAAAKTSVVTVSDAPAALSWPHFVGIEKGFDAREGLEVHFTSAQSATFSVQGVIGGSLDLGGTTMDAAIHAIDSGAPIAVVAAGDLAFASSVITVPEVHAPTDLRGKQAIMPVAKQSGDLLFKRWLSANGVAPESVAVLYDGATPDRYAALKSRQVQAALLTQPFDFRAEDEGYRRLADLGKVAKTDYAFGAIVARKQWLAEHPDLVRAYLRAYSESLSWLFQPGNREDAIAILEQALHADRATNEKTYDYYVTDLKPWSLALPLRAMQGTLDVVAAESNLATPTAPPSKYLDTRFLPM
jgi:ABC-type nitrate/sulfonate/bicarbonate transport system substrate-binding protein